MQNIRSKGTVPERILKSILRQNNLKFSQHLKSLPGKPDFVLRSKNLIIFVDSDFWHGNPNRFVMPKTNIAYWSKKITNNKKRDAEVNELLTGKGWYVLRFWEYDIKLSTPV